jgi:hypothetical protein
MATVKKPLSALSPLSRAEFHRRLMFAEYASKGGKASQAKRRGHRWTAEDAKRWGRLGGQCMQEQKRRSEHPKAGAEILSVGTGKARTGAREMH